MKQNQFWSRYEAAILLDAYIKIINHQITKKDAIKEVSTKLRIMGSNLGLDISETYRNENGIQFQLQSMESAFSDKQVAKPATTLFKEIVELYRTHYEKFEKILMEANSMVNQQNTTQITFFEWLSAKMHPSQAEKLHNCLKIAEDFCIKTKVLNYTLMNTTDIQTLNKFQRTIEQNKIFRIINKKNYNNILTSMKEFRKYTNEMAINDTNFGIVENFELTNISEQDVHNALEYFKEYNFAVDISQLCKKMNLSKESYKAVISILDKADWVIKEPYKSNSFRYKLRTAIIPEYEPAQNAENAVDFENIISYAFTKPNSFIFMGELHLEIKSWTDLYIQIFEILYKAYPNKIPINVSFNTTGRMDLCSEETASAMTSPKNVSNNLMLETNLSSTDIVKKIKSLLNYCSVSYRELTINYSYIKDIQNPVQKSKRNFVSNDYALKFYNWMLNTQKMAEATCRSYLSAVNGAEQFAKDNGLSNTNLFSSDYLLAKSTFDELFINPDFIKINDQQHNRFRSAINKLLTYIKNDVAFNIEVPGVNLESYLQILRQNFPKGFRLTSPLELRKFKRYWQSLNNSELAADDFYVYQNIKRCGIIYEDKLFLPETMLETKVNEELLGYIREEFEAGKTVLYYEAIFKEFSNVFLGQSIYNSKMLKAYLEFKNNGDYFIGRSYISKDSNTTVDIVDEVRNFLFGKCYPTNYNDMFAELSHIPELKIRQALAYNREFISNAKFEYFHVDSVYIDDKDLLWIKDFIFNAIREKEFISGNELLQVLKHKCPQVLDHNSAFTDVGIRDSIAYRLKDEFSFNGNIISEIGKDISMSDVFADFCNNKTKFTLDELKMLRNELKTGVIYFDSVYSNSLRISETEFVSKNQAHFNTAETDKAIDKFCDGEYISIKTISQFGMFPNAGFAWTNYLLEHYVAMYSPNYKLVHSNYNEGVCVGAIVKKLSDIDTFDEVLIDVIANSNQPLTRQDALQYFCDEGYLARRSYKKIEEVLLKAQELRNQKG